MAAYRRVYDSCHLFCYCQAEYCDDWRVCLFACPCGCMSVEPHVQSSPHFLSVRVIVTAARSSSDGVAARYVIPFFCG